MKILFNSKCLEHNSHNHVEGSYRIEPFKYKFEDTGSSKKIFENHGKHVNLHILEGLEHYDLEFFNTEDF
jgi:hypothetical protein